MSAANQHGSLEKSLPGTAYCFHVWGPPRVKGPLCDGRDPGELEGVCVGHEPLDHTHPSGCLPPPSLLPKTRGATLIGGCPRPGVGTMCAHRAEASGRPTSCVVRSSVRWVMCVCAHVCACTHVHACVCVRTGGHMCVYTCMGVRHTHVLVRMCVCTCVSACMCVCVAGPGFGGKGRMT